MNSQRSVSIVTKNFQGMFWIDMRGNYVKIGTSFYDFFVGGEFAGIIIVVSMTENLVLCVHSGRLNASITALDVHGVDDLRVRQSMRSLAFIQRNLVEK